MIKVYVNYNPSELKDRDGQLKMEELLHDLKAKIGDIHRTPKKRDKIDIRVEGELMWYKFSPIFRSTYKSGLGDQPFKTTLVTHSNKGYSFLPRLSKYSRKERKEIARKVLGLYERIKNNFPADSEFLPNELKSVEELNAELFEIRYMIQWQANLLYKNGNHVSINFSKNNIKAEVNLYLHYMHKPKIKLGEIQGERFTFHEEGGHEGYNPTLERDQPHLVVSVNQGESIDEVIAKCLEDLRKEVNVHLTLKPLKQDTHFQGD